MRIKTFMTSCLLLATTLLVSNQKLQAFDFGGMWDQDSCCEGSAYDEGRWAVSVNGGVTPSWFLRHGADQLFFRGIDSLPGDDFPFLSRGNRFDDRWNIPWNVGFEVGYMICCQWEAFFDFSYTQAEGRRHENLIAHGLELEFHPRNYSAYEYYLGTRYYFPTMFCAFTTFVGGKVGGITRDGNRGRDEGEVVATAVITDFSDRLYRESTTIAGGFHVGVNWDISSCLALTLKAEAIFSGDLEGGRLDNVSPFPVVVVGNTGPLLHVPVTLGVRYSF